MKKYLLFFLIASQSLCFSENIKFYIFHSVHGNELKADSVILENCTTGRRAQMLTDTLILTEVGFASQAFINSSLDFKAKANIINNNIEIDIANIGADKVNIELYGYLGNSIYTQETQLNTLKTHKTINLDNINDKLIFLRIKSANFFQTIKLNRNMPDYNYGTTQIIKAKDEILSGDIIDTAYRYNIYVYKKGYRDYLEKNVSFTGRKYYVVNMVEKTRNERIVNTSFKMSGFTVIRGLKSSSYVGPNPQKNYYGYDTIKFTCNTEFTQKLNIKPYSFPRCQPFTNSLGKDYIEVCSGYGNDNYSEKYISLAKLQTGSIQFEDPIFNYCLSDFNYQARTDRGESIYCKILGKYYYNSKNGKYILRFVKSQIEELINSKAINFNFGSSKSDYYSPSLNSSSSISFVSILSIADDAFIEFAYWE